MRRFDDGPKYGPKAGHFRNVIVLCMTELIFGPTKEANGIWRIKTNELDELIKHQNIINCVKAQRLSWFGHANRMPETSKVKRMHR